MDKAYYDLEMFVSDVVLQHCDIVVSKELSIQSLQLVNKQSILVVKDLMLQVKHFLSELVHVLVNEALDYVPVMEVICLEWSISEYTYQQTQHSARSQSMFLRFLDSFDLNKKTQVDYLE